MKYLLGLLLLISVSATAQYSPTAAKTRFVNGIGLGTKDTATMNAADTVAMIVGRDSLVYFRYRGYWKPLAYNSSLTGYIPYTGATSAIDLNAKTVVNISHLGINTTSVPTILLRAIGDNNSTSRISLRGYSSDANSSSMRVTKFRGTVAAPQAPQSGDNLGKFELAGYGTTSSEGYPQATFEGLATENWGAIARGAKIQFKVTPNTTTTQALALTINQDKTAVFESSVTGTSIIKTGGTSSQFLKADGSVTTTIPSGSIDTGRAVTAIATGGSLNKVRDSLVAVNASKYVPYTGATTNVDLGSNTFTSGTITSNENINNIFSLGIRNNNSGILAQTNYKLGNDVSSNSGGLTLFSSNYITGGSSVANNYRANGIYLYNNREGGITLNSEYLTGNIFLATNNITALKIDSIQRVLIPNLSTAGIVTNTSAGLLGTSNGTGFIKMSGGAVSYDNSTYLTTTTAASTYVPYTGATGAVNLGAYSITASSFIGGGSGLTSLPTNTALYPTLNQNTTGNAATATLAQTITRNFSAANVEIPIALSETNSSLYYTSVTINPSQNRISATSFSGAGTGLTGTASSLNIGGNSATVTVATSYANSFYNLTFHDANYIYGTAPISVNAATNVVNTYGRLNVNGATDDGSTALNVTGTAKINSTASSKLLLTGGTTQNAITIDAISGYGNSFYLFNGNGGAGNGFGIYNITTSTLPFNITNAGAITMLSLAGTGSRIVVADASGTLSATTTAATSGTYTPTITLVSNAASSTARVCQYLRVGSVVTVSGYVTVTATTPAVSSRIYMSLPISSSFTSTAQAGGAGGVPGGANIGSVIFANSTATTVSMDFVPTAGALDYWFSYTYQIL